MRALPFPCLQVSALPAAKAPEAKHKRSTQKLDEKVDVYNLADVFFALLGSPPAWKTRNDVDPQVPFAHVSFVFHIHR